MNDKGKFKKTTIILMLVAIVISIFSLTWVLIFKGDDQYTRTNEEFYKETYQVQKIQATTQTPDADDLIDIEITVPVTFILEDVNYNSRLTDEQKEAGFKSVTYDGENSVTYLISKGDHRDFLLSYQYEITEEIESSLRAAYPYFDSLDYNEDLSHFTVKVDSSAYNSTDIEAIANTISLPSMIYQLYALEDIKCSVSIADAQTGRSITSYTP